jgi:UDP-GlcNAc:undecaprenyl-phosphate/decaprenyl-phosphate GlcNAc-1-phosphate transferase
MPTLSDALATLGLAFCVAALLMPPLNRLAVRMGCVDHPSARKIHARPIPLLGGVGVYAGIVVTLWVRGPLDGCVVLMMLASCLVMLVGVWDDRLELPSRFRLMLQVALASGLSLCGARFHFFPVAALDHLVTVLWIVGVINALNCLDCADGAAGGTCVVVFAALAALAAANGRVFVCEVSLAGAGAVLGFLLYNVPPARVFLGDAGSMFLGLMAAALTILADPKPAGPWQMPLAPLVLSVPVFDIVWVHYRRYRAGIRSVRDLLASTGKDHLPHRLMARGFSRLSCMGVIVFLSALAATGVLGSARGQWPAGALAVVILITLLRHLEENAQVVIRQEDRVALYQLGSGRSTPRPSAHRGEGVP